MSSVDVDPCGKMRCSEVFIWNHEKPLNVVLNYTYEKGRSDVENWVKKLMERENELRDAVFEEYEFGIEDLSVEVDEDDEYYRIHITVSLEELVDIKRVEEKIEDVLGGFPKG